MHLFLIYWDTFWHPGVSQHKVLYHSFLWIASIIFKNLRCFKKYPYYLYCTLSVFGGEGLAQGNKLAFVFIGSAVYNIVGCYTKCRGNFASAFGAEGVIKDGRTLVPVRGVFESLGFTVNWDSATNKASISDGVHEVSVIKGLNYFKADGKEIYPDVPQQIINGSFYLPLRAIGDAVGANTSWDNENKMAHISYNGKDVYVKIGGINSENTSSAVKQTSSVKYYSKFTQVPDLGAYFGINGVEVSDNQYLYGWDEFMSVYDRLEEYTDLLIKNGFVFMKNDSGASSIEGNASVNLIYYRKDILVMLSVSTYGLVITMG